MEYNRKTNSLTGDVSVVAQNSGDVKISVQIDEEIIREFTYFFEVECPKQQKFVSKQLLVVNGLLVGEFNSAITMDEGDVYAQLVARDNDKHAIAWKSQISDSPYLQIMKSINASNELNEEQIDDVLQGIVDVTNDYLDVIAGHKEEINSKAAVVYVDENISRIDAHIDSNISRIDAEVLIIQEILTSDEVTLDTLQELVNTLKNNSEGIGNIVAQLATKATKVDLLKKADKSYVGQILEFDYSGISVGAVEKCKRFDSVEKVEAYYGGSWEFYGAGKVLVGMSAGVSDFATIGLEGGECKHTLTASEMPAHTHRKATVISGNAAYEYLDAQAARQGYRGTAHLYTDPSGGDHAHNNLQPYKTVYRYRRLS